jgi:hypothetical protein
MASSASRIILNPDQLVTTILTSAQEFAETTRQKAVTVEEILSCFDIFRVQLDQLAEALDGSQWKLQFLCVRLRDLCRQIQTEPALAQKSPMLLVRRIRTMANAVFHALHPSRQAGFLIQHQHDPMMAGDRRPPAERVWTILQLNMEQNKVAVVASILNPENIAQLSQDQIIVVWNWAADKIEVLEPLLASFRPSPVQLQEVVARAFERHRFDTVAEPVVVHHYELLLPGQQRLVRAWVQERAPVKHAEATDQAVVISQLAALRSQLIAYVLKYGLISKEPTPINGDFIVQIDQFRFQINFAFLQIVGTDLCLNGAVQDAYKVWMDLRDDLQQDVLPPDIGRKVEAILKHMTEFPAYTPPRDADDEWVDLREALAQSRPAGYGSMGTSAAEQSRRTLLEVEKTRFALKLAVEHDDPEALAFECMGFCLMEPEEFASLFDSLARRSGPGLKRLWDLNFFVHLPPQQIWVTTRILLQHEKYAEAEAVMRCPQFRYVRQEILEISDLLKPSAPAALSLLASESVAHYLATLEEPLDETEGKIRTLSFMLALALLNNGWIPTMPPLPDPSVANGTVFYMTQTDDLLGRIPKDTTNRHALHAKAVWASLRPSVEKHTPSDKELGDLMEAIISFRKPMPKADVDEYEAKDKGPDVIQALVQELERAIKADDFTTIKRVIENLSNHMGSMPPAAAVRVGQMLQAIPVDTVAAFAREELGDKATDAQIHTSVSQFFDLMDTIARTSSVPRAPAIPPSFLLISELEQLIKAHSWEAVQKRLEEYFSSGTPEIPTLREIQRLLAPTPLEELKMMIDIMLQN